MKENKNIIWITLGCSIAFCVLAIVFQFVSFSTLGQFIDKNKDFMVNILLGIFSSSILTMLISIVTYSVKKRQNLNNIWVKISLYINKIFIFGEKYLENYCGSYRLNEMMINYEKIKEIKKQKRIKDLTDDEKSLIEKYKSQQEELSKEIDEFRECYTSFELIHSETKFFTCNNKISKCLHSLSETMGDINTLFTSVKAIFVNNISLANIKNEFEKQDSLIEVLTKSNKELQDMQKIKTKQ